jgi:hypothetical protein
MLNAKRTKFLQRGDLATVCVAREAGQTWHKCDKNFLSWRPVIPVPDLHKFRELWRIKCAWWHLEFSSHIIICTWSVKHDGKIIFLPLHFSHLYLLYCFHARCFVHPVIIPIPLLPNISFRLNQFFTSVLPIRSPFRTSIFFPPFPFHVIIIILSTAEDVLPMLRSAS